MCITLILWYGPTEFFHLDVKAEKLNFTHQRKAFYGPSNNLVVDNLVHNIGQFCRQSMLLMFFSSFPNFQHPICNWSKNSYHRSSCLAFVFCSLNYVEISVSGGQNMYLLTVVSDFKFNSLQFIRKRICCGISFKFVSKPDGFGILQRNRRPCAVVYFSAEKH